MSARLIHVRSDSDPDARFAWDCDERYEDEEPVEPVKDPRQDIYDAVEVLTRAADRGGDMGLLFRAIEYLEGNVAGERSAGVTA